eukprot:1963184-Amphidinium_carterae.1
MASQSSLEKCPQISLKLVRIPASIVYHGHTCNGGTFCRAIPVWPLSPRPQSFQDQDGRTEPPADTAHRVRLF